MPAVLDHLRRHYHQRDLAARAWRARGGRVVGYLCDVVPEELIEAAGFLPYRISGRPDFDPAVLARYVYPFEAKAFTALRQTSLEFVDSISALLLSGHYDFVDYLVVPNTRKAILQIARQLADAQQAEPRLRLPQTWVLDRTLTSFFSSGLFNRARLFDFRARLADWSGAEITDEAVATAIALHNEGRALLAEVVARRHAGLVSGSDALVIFGSSRFMPRAEHNALLRAWLAEPCPEPRPGPRVFVGGSPTDHLQLYELIESTGATVVAEEHCWGSRCTDFPVATDVAPIEALAERYNQLPACSIRFPLAETVRRTVGRAVSAGASAAIFHVYRGDEAQRWDVPDERAALQELGIPSLHLAEQPYRAADPADLRRRIAGFLDGLSGARPAGGARA